MTNFTQIQNIIDNAWEDRGALNIDTKGEIRDAIEFALNCLDNGSLRVASKETGDWVVHQWLKKAVVMSFRLYDNKIIDPRDDLSLVQNSGRSFDKVPLKTSNWVEEDFRAAKIRMVPGAIARRGAYIGKDVVMMPSFVNIGAYVGDGTMVDTWASVGSCAQIGKHCHISAGTGIGGVLEPLQANPTIIEDNCFIGARSEVVEGVIVGEGSVLAMGVFITQSTKIVNRATGEIIRGRIPPYSVVVPGALPDKNGGPSLACAVIVKTVDAQTRSKTGVNELLRD